MNDHPTATCPFCCSELPTGAVKCRWCSEFVVADPRVPSDKLHELARRLREAILVVDNELKRREDELRQREEERDRLNSLLTIQGRPNVVRVGTSLDNAERILVLATLEALGGRRTETARILDVSERTLYRKLKQWGVDHTSEAEP